MSNDDTQDRAWFDVPDQDEEDKKAARKVTEIDTRRAKVFDLYFLRDNTQQQVATILGVHVQTVKNDIKAIRESGAARELETSVDERIGAACKRRLSIMSEIWYQYSSINDPDRGIEKLKYLEQFRRACKEYDEFRMDIGILPKAADRKEISITAKMAQEMSTEQLLLKRKELIEEVLGDEETIGDALNAGKYKIKNDNRK